MGDAWETVMVAARDARVVARLEGIYARVGEEIAARGPACWASGRCCNFRTAGHDLFVTLLEAAYCVQRARVGGEDVSASDAGDRRVRLPQIEARQIDSRDGALTREAIDAAAARGDCPYLRGNLCGAHGVKPLGCRVYFCDATAEEWQHALTERMLGEIRGLHVEFGIAYVYDEWRRQLTRCVGA